MTRIAYGGISHETNTFMDELGRTGVEDFTVARGKEIVELFGGTGMYAGGAIRACERNSVEFVPLVTASAPPGPTIERSVFESLADEIIAALKDAGDVDAVVLELHGAGVAEGFPDVEGELAARVRDLVGPDVPVLGVFDLHGNISAAMVATLDATIPVRLYPHEDMDVRTEETVELALAMLRSEVRPTTACARIPLAMPPSTTDAGHVGHEMNEMLAEIQMRPGVLDATVFHGFPYADCASAGVTTIVVTDNDEDLARELAREAARWIWERRQRFILTHPTPAEAVALAQSEQQNLPVVINENCDNPGGGGPGDGTHLLRAMLDADLERSCFGLVKDAEAVEAARLAGVGQQVTLELGGRTHPWQGTPVQVTGVVSELCSGTFTLTSIGAGFEMALGPGARITTGGLEICVTTHAQQSFGPEMFAHFGVDVADMQVVGLKSSNHFRAGFRDVAGRIITTDAAGFVSTDMSIFKHSTTALWPSDDGVEVPDWL